MTPWHKEEEEASRRRATKRDSESSTMENTTRPGGIPRGTSVGEWYKLRTQHNCGGGEQEGDGRTCSKICTGLD